MVKVRQTYSPKLQMGIKTGQPPMFLLCRHALCAPQNSNGLKLNFFAFLFQEARVGNVNVKCTFQLLAAGEQREGTNGQNSAEEKKMNFQDRNPDLNLLNVIPHVCPTLFLHPDQHSRWIYLLSLIVYNSSATIIKLMYMSWFIYIIGYYA